MSVDGGASWKLASKGGFPDRTTVLSIAIDPQDPTTLYAGTKELGLYRGQRGGGVAVNCIFRCFIRNKLMSATFVALL